MSKKITFIIFLFFLISQLFLFTQNALADTILFYDDFSDGNSDGWEEHLGLDGSWRVQDNEYIGSVKYNTYGDSTYALAGNVDWTDYTLEVKVKGLLGVDKKIKFRYKNYGEYYELNLRSGSGYNDLVIEKISSNGWTELRTMENTNEVWYRIKVVLNGPNIKIYVNDGLKFDYINTNQTIFNGKIGLEVWPGAGGAVTTVAFDDVRVTSLTTTPSFLSVPYFSQRDEQWKSDEYDHASKWLKPSQENTIEWWGCALTSGAMVARYFGIDKTPYNEELTPKTLNKWMQDQNDANFRNGAMNWQLLSRMSAKSATLFNTYKLDLSLSKIANNFAKLDEILIKSVEGFSGLPGILEVTHPISPSGRHFVVAKGRSGITYGINDPYDNPDNPTRTLLSIDPYNDSFTKLFWYEPTHSNLSSIFLIVDRNITIRMNDPNIQPIGEQFDLYPLGADGENGESGETLKTLYLDKPLGGNYAIGLSATTLQSYRLDIYLYDRNAEVKMFTLTGQVSPGDQDDIFFYFDLDNVQNSRINREVTFNTLREDINLSYLSNWIDNEGTKNSLLAKVDAAEKAAQKEDKKTGKNILNSLLSELEGQKEKHISLFAYNLLRQDLDTLLSHI